MTKMLVCINSYFNSDHPNIEYLNYDSTDSDSLVERAGSNLKECYDEVYLVDFNTFHRGFIEEIRKHGKKL